MSAAAAVLSLWSVWIKVLLTGEGTRANDQECSKWQCEASERWVSCRCGVYTQCSGCQTGHTTHGASFDSGTITHVSIGGIGECRVLAHL